MACFYLGTFSFSSIAVEACKYTVEDIEGLRWLTGEGRVE